MFYNFVKIVLGSIIRLVYPVKLINKDKIPNDQPVILCSNHSSNLDPIFISIVFPNQISWMAKQELFKSKVLSFILNKLDAFPVDRDGSDISAIKKALRVLKDNKVLGIFPEGTRTKTIDLEKAKPGVALLGVRSKAAILPVFIDSNYKIFRKTNIYIGDPMYLEKDKNTKLGSEDYKMMSKEILRKIYALKD